MFVGDKVLVKFSNGHIEKGRILNYYPRSLYPFAVETIYDGRSTVVMCKPEDMEVIKDGEDK